MNNLSIYQFDEYKTYLKQVINHLKKNQKAIKTRLAQSLQCHSAYISKVLHGNVDFSLEQAFRANRFLNHTPAESRYFLNLVEYARAGSKELKDYFMNQIQEAQEKEHVLKDRLRFDHAIEERNQMKYYGSWQYTAVHTALSIPSLQSRDAIARHLGLPDETVGEILEFLLDIGLARKEGLAFKPGLTNIHLGTDSPMLSKHHLNWRLQTMHAIERAKKGAWDQEGVHYTSLITLSKEDMVKIRSILIKSIEEVRSTVTDSRDETLCCFSIDLFSLGKMS